MQGSRQFQVIVFTPNSETIKCARRLCLCEICKISYRGCEIFSEHHLNKINKIVLRSTILNNQNENQESG